MSDRVKLNDVIHELVGELSQLHINVLFGDLRETPNRVKTASLSARFTRDVAAAAGGPCRQSGFGCSPAAVR